MVDQRRVMALCKDEANFYTDFIIIYANIRVQWRGTEYICTYSYIYTDTLIRYTVLLNYRYSYYLFVFVMLEHD